MNVDEVLAKMDTLDTNEEEIQYIIDENLRVISIPPLGVVLGVEGDKDVNSAKFKMVRYYKGIDLSKFEIRINFANANGDLSYYTVKNPTVTDDTLTFEWLVGYLVTKYKGTVRFIVRMITTDASTGEVQQAFDTTVGEARSLEGLLVDTPTDEKVYDIVAQLKADLTDHVNNLLETIPEDYNELTKKVEDNTLGISKLKEDYIGNGIVPIKKIGAVGDGITDDYIAFQTAINDKNIKEITLEPKTYLIKNILRITDRAGIKIAGNGATIKFDVGDAVNLNDYCFEAANMTNLIIENCTFDGSYEWIERPLHTADTYQNYLDMRAKSRHAFRLTNCTQFYINNVTVQNTLAGFWLTGCTHGALSNCKSLNTLADSVFLVGSHNISVTNHYSNNIDDDSYVSINYTTTASNFANSFDNCYTVKGFGALCCFYGSYSATIRNSRIDSCSYTPIKLGTHSQYKIAGSHQVVENCNIYLTEDIDNYNDNVLNICEGMSSNERASDIILSNVSFYFAKSDGYTIRIVDTNNINIINFNCQCNFEMTNCNNASIENSTLTTVTLNNVTRVPIRSSSLTNISAINVNRLILLGNIISATPTITFNGANSLCTIDDNNFVNNGNIHFLMTTNPLLPKGSPHLAFLIGTILHSGGNLIYVTNNGYKILATD